MPLWEVCNGRDFVAALSHKMDGSKASNAPPAGRYFAFWGEQLGEKNDRGMVLAGEK